ncbi:MAG TPA: hypothetical protein VJ824_08185 [Bacillota bacterium]|nr:hypothetical protein [Bacillota bacterium]
MDEWYIQEPLNRRLLGTPLNPLFDQLKDRGRTITCLDQNGELNAAADDNEAYEIDQEDS